MDKSLAEILGRFDRSVATYLNDRTSQIDRTYQSARSGYPQTPDRCASDNFGEGDQLMPPEQLPVRRSVEVSALESSGA